MKPTNDKKQGAKKARLEELYRQKWSIDEEIDKLLATEKETVLVLPADFSIYDEIENVLRDKPEGMLGEAILRALQTKFSSYGITQKQVTASLVYLTHKRKSLDRIGRGLYKLK